MLIELNEKEYDVVKKVLSTINESKVNEAEEGEVTIEKIVEDLASRTGNDPEDADVDERGGEYLITFGREEYEVFEDYDDAEARAVDMEKDLLEDMGFESGVRLSYIGKDWSDYISNDMLEDLKEEGYYDEIDFDDVKSVREYFSADDIDWKSMAEDVVNADGVAHTLASYDGEEIELLDGKAYAYRVN